VLEFNPTLGDCACVDNLTVFIMPLVFPAACIGFKCELLLPIDVTLMGLRVTSIMSYDDSTKYSSFITFVKSECT